jgi:hypothetical protein
VTCDEARALYSELADAALTADAHAAVAAHLTGCLDCHREWESFQRMLTLLHGMPRVRAPEGFVDRVLSTTGGGRERPTWSRRLLRGLFVPVHVKLPLQAAAVAVLLIGAIYLVQRPTDVQQVAQGPAPESPAAPLSPGEGQPDAARSVPPPVRPAEPEAPQPAAQVEPPETPRQAPPAPRPSPGAMARRELAPGQQFVAERLPQIARSQPVPWPGARTSGAATISGQLAVRDPRTAEQAFSDLLRRVGAIEVRRNTWEDLTAVELEITRGGWAEFVHGLGNIGAWAPDGELDDLPQRVLVIVRMRR